MADASDPDPSPQPNSRAPDESVLSGLLRLGREVPEVDLFAFFTLVPVPLLLIGCMFGGFWIWLALAWIAVLIHVLDRLIRHAAPDAPEGSEFPAADTLSIALGVSHLALMVLAVAAISGATGLGVADRVAVFLGCGMFFGQVSNSNAHELIHRSQKRLFKLGQWVYISMLYGQHTSAHRLVHHRFVATPEDPNSAVLGESFWAFLRQAWTGEFKAGWQAEKARRKGFWNPYYAYVGGGLFFVWLALLAFGTKGMLAYLGLCFYAQIQILLSDYVQHYGLERRHDGNRYEPVTIQHSWDAPDPVSSLWLLNAPRHSDHHAHPARPYPALRLGGGPQKRPILPYSLPVMATIAMFPRIWHRMMDKRVARLRSQ